MDKGREVNTQTHLILGARSSVLRPPSSVPIMEASRHLARVPGTLRDLGDIIFVR
jgi:hypothetical protein